MCMCIHACVQGELSVNYHIIEEICAEGGICMFSVKFVCALSLTEGHCNYLVFLAVEWHRWPSPVMG